jgi:FMN phosphatase YigB (HAD superfamily)
MKTLVWDVDDVLNDLMREWLGTAWLPAHADSPVRDFAELRENPPHRLLGVRLEEYHESLDAFRSSLDRSPLAPSPGVLAWFREHGHRFRHVALTAVPLDQAPRSAAWVLTHFATWIRTFAVTPSPRAARPAGLGEGTKKEFLAWLGKGDVLIDDDEANVSGARALGMETILVPRPWNSGHGTLAERLQALAVQEGRPAMEPR